MSDISIFENNTIFLLGLLTFAPFGILLILSFFFKSIEKPKTAKWLLYMAIGYVVLIILVVLGLLSIVS